jgi:ribosomal protein S27AE
MERPVQLRNEAGATQPATGQWAEHAASERGLKAAVFGVGGFLAAAPLILIPVLHLITTWLLPLLGIVAAVGAWRTSARLTRVRGDCPSCSESIQLDGGRFTAAMHDSCPACSRLVFMAPLKDAS